MIILLMTSTTSAARYWIRPATKADAPAILACLHAAFEPFRSQYSPEGFADTTLTLETLERRMREMDLFVAVAHAEVIGTIACCLTDRTTGHIRGMAVLESWQGSGLAKELLNVAETHVHKLGAERVTLGTTRPLSRAVHFYEKNGYRLLPERGDHFGMPLLKYEKQL